MSAVIVDAASRAAIADIVAYLSYVLSSIIRLTNAEEPIVINTDINNSNKRIRVVSESKKPIVFTQAPKILLRGQVNLLNQKILNSDTHMNILLFFTPPFIAVPHVY